MIFFMNLCNSTFVPNKLGGVIAAFSGILIIYTLPFIFKSNENSLGFKYSEKLIY